MGCWCLKKKKKKRLQALGQLSGKGCATIMRVITELSIEQLVQASPPAFPFVQNSCIQLKPDNGFLNKAEGSPGRNPRQDFKLERKAQSLCQRHTMTLERGKKKGEVKKKESGGEIRQARRRKAEGEERRPIQPRVKSTEDSISEHNTLIWQLQLPVYAKTVLPHSAHYPQTYTHECGTHRQSIVRSPMDRGVFGQVNLLNCKISKTVTYTNQHKFSFKYLANQGSLDI